MGWPALLGGLLRGGAALGRWGLRQAARTAAVGAWAGDKALRSFGGAGLGYGERARAAGRPLDEWSLNHLRSQNAAALQRMLEGFAARTDTFVHTISVKVRGGPAGDLRAAYYLALSAAFGRYARSFSRAFAGYFELGCHTDVTNKEVTVTVGHRTGVMGDLQRDARLFGRLTPRSPYDVMYEGPDQLTVGAGWVGPFAGGAPGTYATNATLSVGGGFATADVTPEPYGKYGPNQVPQTLVAPPAKSLDAVGLSAWVLTVPESIGIGLPQVVVRQFKPQAWRLIGDPFRELPQEPLGTQWLYLRRHAPLVKNRLDYVVLKRTDAAQLPILPDDGRVITTGETRHPLLQPPRPPVDAISRGDWLTLVAQTLTNPGYLPKAPPGDPQAPMAAAGVFVRDPGTVAAGASPFLLQPANGVTNPTQSTPPSPTALGAAVGGIGAIDPPAPPVVPNIRE